MLRGQEHWQPQGWMQPAASDWPEGTEGHVLGSLLETPARGHPRVTLRTGAGGCSTYLVMQIHHEWVLVGRVSGRVKHSWRRAGESVGAVLIYRAVRLLGEGRVQLGLILAQQGCQRSVASSPLTPGRGAVGPSRERNRAGVTPRPGAPQPRGGWAQWVSASPVPRARCSDHGARSPWGAPEPAPLLTLHVPPACPQHKREPWTWFPATITPQVPQEPAACPSKTTEPAPHPHAPQEGWG